MFKTYAAACTLALLTTSQAFAQDPLPGAPPGGSVESPSSASSASPVVTGQEGQWAFLFRFGGLAPFSFRGINDFAVEPSTPTTAGTLFTEFGMRKVLKKISIPFWAGLAMVNDTSRAGVSVSSTSFGVSGGVGVMYTFRAWRRIAPFIGGIATLQFIDPTGDRNWFLGFGVGPALGVEYYIADRLSLFAQGQFSLGIGITDGLARIAIGPTMSLGGNTGVNVYF